MKKRVLAIILVLLIMVPNTIVMAEESTETVEAEVVEELAYELAPLAQGEEGQGIRREFDPRLVSGPGGISVVNTAQDISDEYLSQDREVFMLSETVNDTVSESTSESMLAPGLSSEMTFLAEAEAISPSNLSYEIEAGIKYVNIDLGLLTGEFQNNERIRLSVSTDSTNFNSSATMTINELSNHIEIMWGGLQEDTLYYGKIEYLAEDGSLIDQTQVFEFTSLEDRLLDATDFPDNIELYNYMLDREWDNNLWLSDCEHYTSLSFYGGNGEIELRNLNGISHFKYLDNIQISQMPMLEDISDLESLENLNDIFMSNIGVMDFTVLSELSSLEKLLIYNSFFSDLTILENLVNLERLTIQSGKLTRLADLSKLINLKASEYIAEHDYYDDYVSFADNAIEASEFNASNLPAQLGQDTEWINRMIAYQRDSLAPEVIIDDTYYIADGNYPFFVALNNTNYDSSYSLTIESNGQIIEDVPFVRDDYLVAYIPDISGLLGASNSVELDITIKEKSFVVYTDTRTIDYDEMDLYVDEFDRVFAYGSDTISASGMLYIPVNGLELESIELLDDLGQVLMTSVNDEYRKPDFRVNNSNGDDRYDNLEYIAPPVNKSGFRAQLFKCSDVPVGYYDLRFNFDDGSMLTKEDVIEVTMDPYIRSYWNSTTIAEDSDEVIVMVSGLNYDPDRLRPVIYNEEGIAITEVVEWRYESVEYGQVFYKIKKIAGQEWTNYLYLEINGDSDYNFRTIDARRDLHPSSYPSMDYLEFNPSGELYIECSNLDDGDYRIELLEDYNSDSSLAVESIHIVNGSGTTTFMSNGSKLELDNNTGYYVKLYTDETFNSYDTRWIYWNLGSDDRQSSVYHQAEIMEGQDLGALGVYFYEDLNVNSLVSAKLFQETTMIENDIEVILYEFDNDYGYSDYHGIVDIDTSVLEEGTYVMKFYLDGNEMTTNLKISVLDASKNYVNYISNNNFVDGEFDCAVYFENDTIDESLVELYFYDLLGNLMDKVNVEFEAKNDRWYYYHISNVPQDTTYCVMDIKYAGGDLYSSYEPDLKYFEYNSYDKLIYLKNQASSVRISSDFIYKIKTRVTGPVEEFPLILKLYRSGKTNLGKEVVLSGPGEFNQADFSGVDLSRAYDYLLINGRDEIIDSDTEVFFKTVFQDPNLVADVILDQNKLVMNIGDEESLEATVLPVTAINKNVTWTSYNTEVAIVDQNGLVTAISQGSAYIEVKTEDGAYTEYCEVLVEADEIVYGILQFSLLEASDDSLFSGIVDMYILGDVITTIKDIQVDSGLIYLPMEILEDNDHAIYFTSNDFANTLIVDISAYDREVDYDCGDVYFQEPIRGPYIKSTKMDDYSSSAVGLMYKDEVTNEDVIVYIPCFATGQFALAPFVESMKTGASDPTEITLIGFVGQGIEMYISEAFTFNMQDIDMDDVNSPFYGGVLCDRNVEDLETSVTSDGGLSQDSTGVVMLSSLNMRTLDSAVIEEASLGDETEEVVDHGTGSETPNSNPVVSPVANPGPVATIIDEKTALEGPNEVDVVLVSFKDIKGWYLSYIQKVASAGIMNGKGNEIFDPKANMTRSEMVQVLANLTGVELQKVSEKPFADVDIDKWYTPAVAWAYKEGLVLGDGENFYPEALITRQDLAVMIRRYVEGYSQEVFSLDIDQLDFVDVAQISDYAIESVNKLQRSGIVSGDNNLNFNPKANATRGEAAKVFSKLIEKFK